MAKDNSIDKQEKLETMLMQNLGGQTKSIMVFSEVAYIAAEVNVVFSIKSLVSKSPHIL